MALTKQELLQLNDTVLAGTTPITAQAQHQLTFQLIEALFATNAHIVKAVSLNGTSYQDDDLIGVNEQQILLMTGGTDISGQGANFDAVTGTLNLAISYTNRPAKLYIL